MIYTYHGIRVESGIPLDSALFTPEGKAKKPTAGAVKKPETSKKAAGRKAVKERR